MHKPDSENSTLLVEVDEGKAVYYQQMAAKFEKQFVEMQANYQQSDDINYYLVSKKFIKEWLAFCDSGKQDRKQPLPMNCDLVEPATQELRDGLAEGDDFEIVNSSIFQMFKEFPIAVELKRTAYFLNSEKRVPIYLDSIHYLLLKQSTLQKIDSRKIKVSDLHLKELRSVSKNNKVADFLQSVQEAENIKKYDTRVWVCKQDMDIQAVYDYIAKECAPLHYYNMKIRGIGKLVEENSQQLCDIGMQDGDYLIVEVASYTAWFFREQGEEKCEGCFKYRKLKIICGCKKVGYCTVSCQEKDRYYHTRHCQYAQQQQLNQPIDMTMDERSSRGLVGLTNLGNTCFMNSCLQCLSHSQPLTQYFLGNYYQGEINRTNPIGSKGKLAKSYAMFINKMWVDSQRTYSPSRLKNSVASINQMFSGYSQHDSQEFFSFLVDGLHEDLNRIEKKPYIESVDSNGRPDHQIALESWIAHIQRNQSIIIDTMTGQYKSKVVCPDCQHQSITFDPFITVTLPIPEQATVNHLSYFVLFSNNMKETKKMSLSYRKADLEAWTAQAAEAIKCKREEFKFYILTFLEDIYDFEKKAKTEIIHKIESEERSVFLIQLDEEEQALKNELELVCRLAHKVYRGEWEGFWFKRPFWFNRQTTKGLDVYKRILKYLYHDTYDYSEKRYKESKGKGKAGKTYEQYIDYMLQHRPFKLVLKSNKKVERLYYRTRTRFEQQVDIDDDKNIQQLLDELNITDISDCELDARFTAVGQEKFSMDRLRKFSLEEGKDKKIKYHEPRTRVTLDECFQVFQEPELLMKGNEWYCPKCKEHKLATKELTIYKAPQILILHFKRFKSRGILRKQKNDTTVEFPLELDLTKYVIDKTPINSYIPEIEKTGKYMKPSYEISTVAKQAPNYQLYAISNHYGGMGGGHYTAYAKNNEKWYCFNDSSVSPIQSHSIQGSQAYMLFYQRKN